MKYAPVQHFINGKAVNSTGTGTLPLVSPLDGQLLSQVPLGTKADLDAAGAAGLRGAPGRSENREHELVRDAGDRLVAGVEGAPCEGDRLAIGAGVGRARGAAE